MSLDSNVQVWLYSDHIKGVLGGQQLDLISTKSRQGHIKIYIYIYRKILRLAGPIVLLSSE